MMDYKGENVQIVWNRPIQIGLFKWVEETHISIERKPTYLEEGSSSTMPIQVSRRNTYIYQKKTNLFRRRII
jgi:hypothetical protein